VGLNQETVILVKFAAKLQTRDFCLIDWSWCVDKEGKSIIVFKKVLLKLMGKKYRKEKKNGISLIFWKGYKRRCKSLH